MSASFRQHEQTQRCSLSSARGVGLGIRGSHLSPSAVALLLAAYPSGSDWEDPAEREAARTYLEQSLGAISSDAETGELWLPCLPPNNSRCDPRDKSSVLSKDNVLRIFTDMEAPPRVVGSRSGIDFVTTKEDANVWLWTRPITNFLELPPSLRVCQFPYEGAFVQKDLLPLAVRKYCYGRAGEPCTRPSWWLPTFDLSTEFHLFQSEFERRRCRGDDNIWIIKPAIGTHGVGHSIVATLEDTVKAIRTANGSDKVAQLLVQRPACAVPRTMLPTASSLKHKFDLRVFVIARSFGPVPDLYRHSHLYARLANKPYDATLLSDDTVQITSAGARDSYDYFAGEKPSEDLRKDDGQYRLLWDEYVAQLEGGSSKTFPTGTGQLILQDIDQMLWELFSKIGKSVVGGPWPRSRAYYGVDVILQDDEDGSHRPSPRLLEVNFMADWDVALLAGVQADREDEVLDWANDLITALATDDDLQGHPRLHKLLPQESA